MTYARRFDALQPSKSLDPSRLHFPSLFFIAKHILCPSTPSIDLAFTVVDLVLDLGLERAASHFMGTKRQTLCWRGSVRVGGTKSRRGCSGIDMRVRRDKSRSRLRRRRLVGSKRSEKSTDCHVKWVCGRRWVKLQMKKCYAKFLIEGSGP